MIEVSRSRTVRSMILRHKTQQNTARIARIIVNVAICRTFLRSVLTVIITRVGGSIARISQIATAGPTSEIGGFAGFLGLQRVRGRYGRYLMPLNLVSMGAHRYGRLQPVSARVISSRPTLLRRSGPPDRAYRA
jgi:hypothetical protein